MLVAEYMFEMEMNNKYKEDWKKNGHDEPAYNNMISATTTKYYLKTAATNENDSTKNENYY